MIILASTVIMLILGLVLGLMLAVFAQVFEVKEDPAVGKIFDILPAYNCGNCGYAGCRQFAEALVKGHVPTNRCAPGGKETRERIELILGSRGHGTEQPLKA